MKKEFIKGANPYMPLWEHVPDGEPRVFEYKGKKRVYLYGSHDTLKTEYCGPDQVVWSAPIDDLTNWTCHGVCYTATDGGILYAPDVVQKGDTFYMYAAEAKGSKIMVAESKNPAGPFKNPRLTELGFDPGILVDDDGRVYAYWGFCHSYCAQLNDDMATIKKETFHDHPIGHTSAPWSKDDDGGLDLNSAFFEASSPRKIMGKYVYVYSKRAINHQPELGVYENCNGFLSYKVSDKPLEGFADGGDISFNGGEIIFDKEGKGHMSFKWGNNHGSLMQVNGQWYIFYHRQTGVNEFSRQAMIEPVDIAMDKKGKIFIGKITYDEKGEPVSSVPVEMTSQGPQVNGLDAYKWISAGYAVHLYGGSKRPVINPTYEKTPSCFEYIYDITNGTTIGYRYLQFGLNSAKTVTADIEALADMTINIRIDSYQGKVIASGKMAKGDNQFKTELTSGVIGKHAIYFEFLSNSNENIAIFNKFTFDK